MKRIHAFFLPLVFIAPLWSAQIGDDQKSPDTSDHYTISNPLVLLTGASKYNSYYTDDEGNKYYLSNLDTVEKEMKLLYNIFADICGYVVKSTYFDKKGNVKSRYLYEDYFEKWMDDNYDHLRKNINNYDALFFIFSGHGDGNRAGNHAVFTTGENKGLGKKVSKLISWTEIQDKFIFPSHNDLKNWAAKHKKFFFKLACNGSGKPIIQNVKSKSGPVNLDSTVLNLFATSPGKYAGADNGVRLANLISETFHESVKKRKSLSFITETILEKMSKPSPKYGNELDAPRIDVGFPQSKVFFYPKIKRKYMGWDTDKKWCEAIKKDDEETLKDILAHYVVHINAGCIGGWKPLHIAAFFNSKDVVKTLIAAGADKSIKNYDNQTPLDVAKKWGYKDIVDLLT